MSLSMINIIKIIENHQQENTATDNSFIKNMFIEMHFFTQWDQKEFCDYIEDVL